MRTIAVIEGFYESSFNNHLAYVLDLLNIKYKLYNIQEEKNNIIDYVVLNSNKKDLKNINARTEHCFVNMDTGITGGINIYGNMITYGFGIKNTVTLSSIDENNASFVYCLQRYLMTKDDIFLEPQEIPVNLKFKDDIEPYSIMVAITIALLEGLNSSEIEKKLNKKLLVLT